MRVRHCLARGGTVIRGLVYLTGVMTLSAVALVVAVAMRVDTWPWRNYAETGRQYVVGKLEDSVSPATWAFPESSKAMLQPSSNPLPPRNVE